MTSTAFSSLHSVRTNRACPFHMAPATKKRKEPHPNITLMNFFSGADATKRAKLKTPQQLTHIGRQNKIVSREIIVIDSDSDDGVHGKDSDGGGSARPDFSFEDKDTFGAPSELLRSTPQPVEASSNAFNHAQSQFTTIPKPDQSESMFGVSAPLLEEAFFSSCFSLFLRGWGPGDLNLARTGNQLSMTERSQSESFTRENASTIGEANSVDDSAVCFPIGEWPVGDDELVALKFPGNSAEIGEGRREHFDEQTFCPVCSTDLTGVLVLVSTLNRRLSFQFDLRYPSIRKQKLMSTNVLTKLRKATTLLCKSMHRS